jgi:hypothetical protein
VRQFENLEKLRRRRSLISAQGSSIATTLGRNPKARSTLKAFGLKTNPFSSSSSSWRSPYEIWLALKFIVECDYFTGRVIEVDGGSTF